MTTILKLNKLSTFWLFTILFIGNGARVAFTAPAEDFSELLSLVPPNKEATVEYTDSYGNPIETPDGKKVVSAKETSDPTTPLTQFATQTNTDPNISPVQNHQSPTQSFLSKISSNQFNRNNKIPPEQRPTTFKPSGFVPFSNGNFNYPNISQDILIINKIASKYKTTLPKLEPLAVAEEPVTSLPEIEKVPVPTQKIAESSQIYETVFDESKVPDWIAAFNDPNVGPAQPYIPDPNMSGLSVITWGLVPPKEELDTSVPVKETDKDVVITRQSIIEITQPPTTPRSTTSTTTQSTTTTSRTTTTTRRPTTTTTTRRPTTTTTRRTTTTRGTTTSAPINKETDIYSLENHVQGQLPQWLVDYNDTDLASGVPYEIPADLNEVKNTVTLGLIAPLAPFTDIAPLKLPSSLLSTTSRPISSSFSIPISTTKISTTTTTTTTLRPTTTTISTTTTTTTTQPPKTTSTSTTESPLITANGSKDKNVFEATLPPWLADFNDPDVGPGVPYVFKDEDVVDKAGGSQGIVESSSNIDVVVSSTTPSQILSSTTAAPAQTFTAPPPVKGHLASNSVFPSTATTSASGSTVFKKTSQPQQQAFPNQFLNRNSIPNSHTSSPTPFKQPSFSFAPSTFSTTPPPSFTSSPTKFTGRFGGAPGILGEQSTPGFGVRPSAFSRPAATIAPAASSIVERKVFSSDRYTGGFGGPPGILTPYDNVKKSG